MFKFYLHIVADKQFPVAPNITDLQLGNGLNISCVPEQLYPAVSVSWFANSSSHSNNNNILAIMSLKPFHNNTNYTCVISIQRNHPGCSNQSKEFVIREKGNY